MNEVVNIILKNEATPHYVVGRIGSLTLNIFYTSAKMAIETTNYIGILLDHLYLPSVLATFEKLFSESVRYETTQDWMIKNSIPQHITDLIVKTDVANVSDDQQYYSKDVLNLEGLYKLLLLGYTNHILKKGFQNEATIQCVTKDNTGLPSCIRGMKWTTIVMMCMNYYPENFYDKMDIAIQTITRPDTVLRNEVVQCINFLSMMLKHYSKEAGKRLSESQILNVLIRLIIQFPNASILHYAFRVFVVTCFQNKVMMPKVIATYVPLFIVETHDHINGLFYASCWKLLINLDEKATKEAKKELAKIPEYDFFAKKELPAYKKKLNASYGGRLPIPITSIYY